MRGIITHGAKSIVFGSVIFLSIWFIPSATATAPLDDCMLYAYTYDAGTVHYSLLRSESSMFGTDLVVKTDCEGEFIVYVDDEIQFGGNQTGSGRILPGHVGLLTIESENWSQSFRNITFFQTGHLGDALYDYDPHTAPGTIPLSMNDISEREIIVSIGTGILIWGVVTGILWRVINSYIDRNFIEEVVR